MRGPPNIRIFAAESASMRSLTTRLIIFIASLLIAVIIGMQVHWLSKTYAYEKHEFSTSVLKAVRGVYEDIPLLYNVSVPLDSLVERPDQQSFLFRIDSIPSHDTLLHYLSGELEIFHVFTDYKVAVFDPRLQQYISQDYISADASSRNEDSMARLPLVKRDFSYVHLFFPNRHRYIIREMRSWIYSSAVLLLLLICFSFSIYYFMKQKFLVEIQKDFINNVTHEFSTPLSVIDLSVEALEKPGTQASPEKINRYISSIKYQSSYLKNHITNLINTVVAGHYQPAYKSQPVSPNDLLRKAVMQLDTLLVKKDGKVEWQLDPSDPVIMADEENLYLAFFNIINNAIKYSREPRVVIRSSAADNRYTASIRDNGPGIDPAEHKRIFKKFYRVQNGNVYSAKGLGLGLYFTRRVIDAHHGQVRVSSVPGIGTDFTIELPMTKTS